MFLILRIAVIFIFYPEFYGIYDEDLYLTTTYAMQNGSFFYEEAGVDVPLLGTAKGTQGTISMYPPGNSALLLPFTGIHWRLAFLKNILLYIGSFLLFVSILRKLKIDPVYSLIFLLDKKSPAAGFSLGFLLLLRYPNLVLVIGIFGALLYTKEYKKALLFLPGVVFFSFALFVYIMHAYGFILGPFAIDGAKSFSIRYFIFNFPYYLLSLNVLYPGMLLAAIFFGFKSRKASFFIIPALVEKLVKGQRFMVPIIPLLLIPYLDFLRDKKFMKKIFIFSITLLFVLNCAIQYKHHRFVREERLLSQIVGDKTKEVDIILCNSDTDELFNPYFSKIRLIELSKIEKHGLNVLRDNYKISFVFVELKRGRRYEEKSRWIEYFKNEGFELYYESQEPVPVIVMNE